MGATAHGVEARFAELVRAFNAREIEAVLAHMTEDVDWPNAWEGGRVHGRAAVRDYWTRQWAQIDPRLELQSVSTLADDRVRVDVRQLVRGLDGSLISDASARHTYTLRDGLIARMDVS
jgi:ketosteroid isomerase-like protein